MIHEGTHFSRRAKTLSLIILALSIVVSFVGRLLYLHTTSAGDWNQLVFPDEGNYYLSAANQVMQDGLSYFLSPRSLWNGPGNILWVALWKGHVAIVKIANSALLSILCFFVWDIARRYFGYIAATVACLLYAFHPPLYVFGITILTEPLFVFLVIFSYWLFLIDPGDRFWIFIPGLLMGGAILVRPTAQLLPIVLIISYMILALFFKGFKGEMFQDERRKLLLYLLGSYLLVAPYIIKNYLYLDSLKVANGFGAVLYLGNDLRKDGDEPIYSRMDFDTFDVTYPYAHLDSEGDKRPTSKAIQMVLAHPIDIVRLTLRKVFRYTLSYPNYYFYPQRDLISFFKYNSIRRVLLRGFELCLVSLVVITSLFAILSKRFDIKLRVFSAVVLIYFIALHSVSFPIPRLALPIFPIFCVLASGYISNTLSAYKLKQVMLSTSLVIAVVTWISCLELVSPSQISSERYISYSTPRLELDVKKPMQVHDLKIIEDGSFQSTGRDPFVVFPIPAFLGQKNDVIFIKLGSQSVSNDNAQVFWQIKGEKSFSENMSSIFSLSGGGKSVSYSIVPSFDPGWQQELQALRIDFPNDEIDKNYKIERLLIAR